MKAIVIESYETPDENGYPDRIAVIADHGGIAYHGFCGASPNPYRPRTDQPWQEVYGWVAPGEYEYECIEHERRGKALAVNGRGRVPTRNPNPNHDGEMWAAGILVHRGSTDFWRGSAGCITIPPDAWETFISTFEVGERGELKILDFHDKAPNARSE